MRFILPTIISLHWEDPLMDLLKHIKGGTKEEVEIQIGSIILKRISDDQGYIAFGKRSITSGDAKIHTFPEAIQVNSETIAVEEGLAQFATNSKIRLLIIHLEPFLPYALPACTITVSKESNQIQVWADKLISEEELKTQTARTLIP